MKTVNLKFFIQLVIGVAAGCFVAWLAVLLANARAADFNRAEMSDYNRHLDFVDNASHRIELNCLSMDPLTPDRVESCMTNQIGALLENMTDDRGYSENDRLRVKSELITKLRLPK